MRYARDRHTLCKKLEAPPVPSPYTPPLARRAQAVRSARGRFRQRLQAVQSARRRIPRRGWWLVPLLGLLPVLVAVVLASEGRFGALGGQPVATGALATSTAVAGRPAPVSGVPLGPTATAAGQTATNATTGSQVQSNVGQSTGQPTTTQPTTAAGTSPSQAAGAGAKSNGTLTATGETAAQGRSVAATTGPFRAYAVQPGDTVKFVAQMYGVSSASISQASGLQNPDYLRVGQVLTIPAQPGWLYRIQPGESLDQIAARTGVPSAIIASASNLATDSARPGDVILIPDQAAAARK